MSRIVEGLEMTTATAPGEGSLDEPERVGLRRGALSDVEANLLVVSRTAPHRWALSCDLPRAAESLGRR